MGNKIEIRKLVKDLLNTDLVDPYPTSSTRPGNGLHFYDEADNINLSRGDTFPKGFIKLNDSPATERQTIGSVGHATKYASIGIYYYVKELQTYTEDGIEYREKDLVNFMLGKIEQTLLDNSRLGEYHMSVNSISEATELPKIKSGNFSLYVGYRTITYYWSDTYGS